jgi:hypothetical protein
MELSHPTREPPVAGEDRTVSSWDELRQQVVPALKRLNGDPALALAAAANPLHALEEIGITVAPEARSEIEDRLRFRPGEARRLGTLRASAAKIAGRRFDLGSDEEVGRVLFEDLGLKRPRAAGAGERVQANLRAVEAGRPLARAERLPLETLVGQHEIVDILVEYRKIDDSEPRLATREVYDSVRQGKVKLPVTRVRGRFKDKG